MRAGRIREDFFYRLCGDQVNTVALHEILASRPDEIIGFGSLYLQQAFWPGGSRTFIAGGRYLRAQVPKNYEWPGNFRELAGCAKRHRRNEYVPVLQGEESNRIETVYENTEVSLAQWSLTYARRRLRMRGSYREAARRLKIDQRTLKKLVES